MLRLIPGLIINQHQGGGKAEQYLIRGFDADHGTDLAIFVDNVPVNMRSHAHGQGYADLHFLIPETVRAVDVLKGPYFAEYGDFDTAARRQLPHPRLRRREHARDLRWQLQHPALPGPAVAHAGQVKTFLAIEGYHSDGPFDHPNGYLRFNVFGKASTTLAEDMKLVALGLVLPAPTGTARARSRCARCAPASSTASAPSTPRGRASRSAPT